MIKTARIPKLKTQTSYPLVYLEWHDAGKLGGDDWMLLADIITSPNDVHLNISVGWLLQEDEYAIVISPQIAINRDSAYEYDSVMRIPLSMITQRIYLDSQSKR